MLENINNHQNATGLINSGRGRGLYRARLAAARQLGGRSRAETLANSRRETVGVPSYIII